MARDLKLTAVLVDKVSSGLAKAGQNWKKTLEEPAKSAIKSQEAANKKIIDNDEKLARERIKLQRASIDLMYKQEKEAAALSMRAGEQSLRTSKSQADAALKIQRQAAIAESALILNKFDRQIAKEKQIHAFRLADLKGNDAAIEAEIRRHNAVIGRMSMDKANFPNTPFQSLLSGLTKVTGQMGLQVPQAINLMESNMANAARGAAGLAVGLAATGAAAIALGAGVKYAYGEARESIDADKKLDLVLRSTGRGAEFSREELVKLANQYQDTTDYSDEAVKSAETILLRYDAISKDVFPKALKAAADLGAETGDLAGAAFNLGNALQMPEEGGEKLTAMSIKLTETEKKMLQQFAETGETAKAQEFILDKVAKAYGGAAQTMSHDTVKLGHAIGELAETIGTPLVKAVDKAAQAMLGLIKSQDKDATHDYYLEQLNGMRALQGQAKLTAEAVKKAEEEHKEKPKQEKRKATKEEIDAAIEAANYKDTVLKNQADRDARFKAAELKRENDFDAAYLESIREKNEAEKKIREASEKERTEAKSSLAMAKTSDPIEQLKLKQEQELSLITDHQARTATVERQGIELKQAIAEKEAQLFTAKTGYVTQYANSVSDMVGIIGGKSKAAFAIQKGIALGEIAVRTASAVVTDNSSPATWWKVPYDIALGATQAAVVAGTALKGFEKGGWTGSGGRNEVAGVVHGGEMVWSQADVRRAGGRQQAEQIRQGNNTTTVSAPINIVINGNADQRVVKQLGETIEQKLRNHAWMNKEVAYRGITA